MIHFLATATSVQKVIAGVILAGLLAGGVGIVLAASGGKNRAPATSVLAVQSIPPIDAAAPAEFETATLALG